MRLAQLTDSTLPVGLFSFSAGLETAVAEGVVHDHASLEAFIRDAVRQAQTTDLIAALHAHRARMAGDYGALLRADRAALLCKLSDEQRIMTRRTGRKLAELACSIEQDYIVGRLAGDIVSEDTPGCYPAVQGAVFAACGLTERQLAASQLYGAAAVVAGAALRCMRITHYQTQRILFSLSADADSLYQQVRDDSLDDIRNFSPQLDILASLHEKGTQRMFMN